ncbi:MAG: serine hydrolase domain-containing protein [Candidatus Woesearchaeota archaeon]
MIASNIERRFRNLVRSDTRLKNAYLLVRSDALDVHVHIAEGHSDMLDVHQPNHLASVGKLFTATLIGILCEEGKLRYDDPIARFLDVELMDGLHVCKGVDYSDRIKVRHLLMQTSGLNDVFYELYRRMVRDETFRPTTRDAVLWGKEHLKPVARPGRRHYYTDTNYYLLGFIIERVTGKWFHEALRAYLFEPLGMDTAYAHGFEHPRSKLPTSGAYVDGIDLLSVEGIHEIDYAGGSVVAPLEEYLLFFEALVEGRIIGEDTLRTMIEDDVYMGFPTMGFRYGYSIWKPVSVPFIMPRTYWCWGCVGVTGAFMFYHPPTGSYVIGSFNEFAYRGKALDFMFRNVVGELVRGQRAAVRAGSRRALSANRSEYR